MCTEIIVELDTLRSSMRNQQIVKSTFLDIPLVLFLEFDS